MPFWTVFAIVLSAVSFTASYVQAKKAQKRAKRLQDEMAGVLVNKESNIEAIPVVYGERRVGGVRVYMTTSGDDRHEYLYVALVVSEGRVESISDLEIDEVPATDPRFLGLVSYNYQLGDDDQTVNTVLDDSLITVDDQDPNWEYQGIIVTNQAFVNNFRLRGVAYVAIRLKYDAEVFAGVPDFTVKVKGRRVYDPRKDSTSSHYDSNLGVSDHRATDDSTWDWTDNPALCLRDYLTNDRFGKGLDASDIDDDEFMQAADDIDSFTVTPYSGGSSGHKLFSLNAVIDTNEQIFTNVEKILLSCRGFLPYTFGKYGLKVDQAGTSQMTLGTDKIIGDISIVGSRKEDRFNQVIVKFPDANTRFQPNNVAWPDQSSSNPTGVSDGNGGYLTEAQLHAQFLAEDGELLVDEIDLEHCTDIYQARDLARIFLWRSRNALNVALQATSEAMELTVGDVVSITHPTPNWTAKKFQVDEMGINYDGTVTLKCVEYDATIYAYDSAVEQEDLIDIITGDPGNVQAPTNVTGTNTGSALLDDGTFHAVLNVSWTASQDATVIEYEVRYKLSSETPYKYLKTTDTTVRIEGMAPGTYNIGVRALDAFGGKSAFTDGSNVNTGIDTTIPGDITNTSVTAGIGNLVASWENPDDDDLKQIRVYVATTNTKPTDPTAVVTGEAYAVTNVVGSTDAARTRYFWLEAEDYSGNVGNTTASFTGIANQATGDDIGAGEVDTGNIADDAVDITKIANILQSTNYVAATSGWKLTTDGTFEAGDGTFRGTVTATDGNIGGWNIDSNAIYVGTKVTSDAFTTNNGDITIFSDGTDARINSKQFRIDSDGSAHFQGEVSISAGVAPSISTNTPSGKGILLKSDGDVFFGDATQTEEADNKYFFFDQSAGTVSVKGALAPTDLDLVGITNTTILPSTIKAQSYIDGSVGVSALSEAVFTEVASRLGTGSGGFTATKSGHYLGGATTTIALDSTPTHGSQDVIMRVVVSDTFVYPRSFVAGSDQLKISIKLQYRQAGSTAAYTTAGNAEVKTLTPTLLQYATRYTIDETVTRTLTSSDITDNQNYDFRVKLERVGSQSAFADFNNGGANDTTGTPISFEVFEGTQSISTGGNADTLDNLDSSQFLRSDVDDTFDGDLTITGDLKLGDTDEIRFGDDEDLKISHSGGGGDIENDTGNLTIKNRAVDGDIYFMSDDGTGYGTDTYMMLDGGEKKVKFLEEVVISDDLTVTGNLTITGNIDQYNVTDLDVTDKTITVNSDGTQALSDGAGLIVDRGTAADASITWNETNDQFEFNNAVQIDSGHDQILSLNQATTGWNYIGFEADGTRKFYLGNNASDGFVVGSDVTNKAFTLDNFGSLNIGSANINSSGTVTWSGGSSTNANTAYTYSQVGHLPLAGGTLTGNVAFNTTNTGLTWSMNTDGAYIKFFNTGDGDTNSRLEYATTDNGNEYHRFLVAGVERFTVTASGITATGYNKTNWDTAYTYSQVGHLPLTGGTVTGAVTVQDNLTADSADINEIYIGKGSSNADQNARNIGASSNYLLLQRDADIPIELWGSKVESRSTHYFGSQAGGKYINTAGAAVLGDVTTADIDSVGTANFGNSGSGAHKLNIHTTGNQDAIAIYATSTSGTSDQSAIRFFKDGGLSAHIGLAVDAGRLLPNTAANDFAIKTWGSLHLGNGNGTNLFTFTNTGNMKVGSDTVLTSNKALTNIASIDMPTSGSQIMVNAYSTTDQNGGGIFFRDGFDGSSNQFNLSIIARSRGDDGSTDGLSINGYEGIAFSTGSNTYNERLFIDSSGNFDFNDGSISNAGAITSEAAITAGDGSSSLGYYVGSTQVISGSRVAQFAQVISSGTLSGTSLYFNSTHSKTKIRLYGSTDDAHNIGTESFHNTYGPNSWDLGTIGHKFYGSSGSVIATIGTGGTSGNHNSEFYGSILIDQTSSSLINHLELDNPNLGGAGGAIVFTQNGSTKTKLKSYFGSNQWTFAIDTEDTTDAFEIYDNGTVNISGALESGGITVLSSSRRFYASDGTSVKAAYSFDGDSGTGISHTATGRIDFLSSGAVKAYIRTGTTNPISDTMYVDGQLGVNGKVVWTGGSSTNANTAYGWGDHSTQGYLTSSSAIAATQLTGTINADRIAETFTRRVYSTGTGSTPENRWVALTLPFLTGGGSSSYYAFEVQGYRDIGSMDSQNNYRVYVHIRSNGSTFNSIKVKAVCINEGASEPLTFGYKQVASTSNIVYTVLPEDYSGAEFHRLTGSASRFELVQASMFSATDTDPTGINSVTTIKLLDNQSAITTSGAITAGGALSATGSTNVYAATFTGATGPSVTSLGLNVKTLDGANDVALLVEKTDGTDLFKITGQGVGSFSQRINVQGQDITDTRIQNWQTAYGWGDHSTQGYLTSSSAIAATQLTGTINNNRLSSDVLITDGGTYSTGFAADLDTITGFRIHRVTGFTGTDHRAFTGHHNLLQLPNTSNSGPYEVQLAFTTVSSGTPEFKFRSSATNWSDWVKVFNDGYHPNADKWTTARTLSLTGAVTGSVSWDGSGNASLATSVGNLGNVTVTDLLVDGTTHASIKLDRASTSNHNNLLYYTNGSLTWRIWQSGNDNTLAIRNEASTTNVMTMTNTDTVFANNVTANGSFVTSTASTAVGIYAGSTQILEGSTRVLKNVNANANILTSGTLPSGRLSGTYDQAVYFSNNSLRLKGHMFFNEHSAGRHYIHFATAESTNRIDWRIQTNSANNLVHSWTESAAIFRSKMQINTGSGGNSVPTNYRLLVEDNANAVIALSVPATGAGGLFFPRGTTAYYSGIERANTTLHIKHADASALSFDSTRAATFTSSVTSQSLSVVNGIDSNTSGAGTNLFRTNTSDGRVLRLRDRSGDSGNIIQFEQNNGSGIWEVVGRSSTFYVYKNGGVGSGFKWQIDSSGDHTITGNATFSAKISASDDLETDTRLKFTNNIANGWGAPIIFRESAHLALSDYSGVKLGGYNGTAYGPRFHVNGNGNVDILEGDLRMGTTTVISSVRRFYASNGTVAKAAFSFNGESNTGMYKYGTNQIGFTAGGSLIAYIQSGATYGLVVQSKISATGGNSDNWNTAYTYSQVGHVPLAGGTMTGALAINSGSDGILTLNQATTGWNYIQFQANGTRKFYVGNNSTDGFVIGSDVANKTFQLSSFGSVDIGSANINSTGSISSGSITSSGDIKTTGGDFKIGSDSVITSNRDVYARRLYYSDYADFSGLLYLRDNINVLNATDNGWNTFAARSNGRFNLTIGSLVSNSTGQFENIGIGIAPSTPGIKVYHTNNYEAGEFITNQGGSLIRYRDNTSTSIEIGIQGGVPVIRTGSVARLTVDGSDLKINSGALKIANTPVITSGRFLENVTLEAGAAGARFKASDWHQSADGKSRFYFANNSHTYYRTGNAFIYRNNNDGGVATIDAAGRARLQTSSDQLSIGAGLQIGNNTFTGSHGVFSSSRIGAMVNGSLTSYVYASTYNDANYPDYGFVFIHGPSTSSYNVWSISPDGPAKGNALNFIYGNGTTNIHTIPPKVVFDGSGNVDIKSGALQASKAGYQLRLRHTDLSDDDWRLYSWANGLNFYPQSSSTVYFGRDGASTNVSVYNGNLVMGTGDTTIISSARNVENINHYGVANTSTVNQKRATFTYGASDANFQLAIANGSGSTTNSEQAWLGLYYGSNKRSGISFLRSGNSYGGDMVFTTNQNNTRMTIAGQTGNIGIGVTPNASYKLYVGGSIAQSSGSITAFGDLVIGQGGLKRGSTDLITSALELRNITKATIGSPLSGTFPDTNAQLDIASTTAQTNFSSNALTYGSDRASVVLDCRHSASKDGTLGFAGPLMDFRSNNSSNQWSLAHIIGTIDPEGGTGHQGGLVFSTSGGGTSDPTGRRNQGAAPTARMLIGASGNVTILTGDLKFGTSPTTLITAAKEIRNVANANVGNLRIGHSSLGTTGAYQHNIESTASYLLLQRNQAVPIEIWGSRVELRTTTYFGSSSAGYTRGLVDTSGNATFEGNVTAYGSPSDIRLKENVERITDPIDKVKQLDGITFDYKKDGSRSTGLIAQQLLEVLPEVVYETEDLATGDTHYAVRYGQVVGLLVEAIKNQQDQIDSLKDIIKEMTDGNN